MANVVVIEDEGARNQEQGLSEQVGTTTNRNGYYELLLEPRDTITLVFSMVGYTTVYQRIVSPQEVMNVNVEMATSEEWLEEVEVRGVKRQTTMMDHIDAGASRVMPDATGGSIESLLITFAGVNQNNELSSQYNVRGGSFDENVVYVNGIEVHRPLLIRSGQQEGLSFVNPSMVENVEFSAGGYGAQYGDKMASVLDIRYKRPERFEGSLSASLLGASVYVGMGDPLQLPLQQRGREDELPSSIDTNLSPSLRREGRGGSSYLPPFVGRVAVGLVFSLGSCDEVIGSVDTAFV